MKLYVAFALKTYLKDSSHEHTLSDIINNKPPKNEDEIIAIEEMLTKQYQIIVKNNPILNNIKVNGAKVFVKLLSWNEIED